MTLHARSLRRGRASFASRGDERADGTIDVDRTAVTVGRSDRRDGSPIRSLVITGRWCTR
ncbi:hypothetical protein EA472_14820 [Natrarchaeobius oligotrophus]|uniref:Uncharacterized protein n=1 Tax=Natrarchaeobius chitinivorans TaxID=1679083 RepID=A0A3N6MW36_NATCH|nr:hypothetical protein EA472_14820 [Natrarchaeobius chitinivorans]